MRVGLWCCSTYGITPGHGTKSFLRKSTATICLREWYKRITEDDMNETPSWNLGASKYVRFDMICYLATFVIGIKVGPVRYLAGNEGNHSSDYFTSFHLRSHTSLTHHNRLSSSFHLDVPTSHRPALHFDGAGADCHPLCFEYPAHQPSQAHRPVRCILNSRSSYCDDRKASLFTSLSAISAHHFVSVHLSLALQSRRFLKEFRPLIIAALVIAFFASV